MSTDRLREAARVLRERAEAATPGEWRDVPMGSEGSTILADPPATKPSIITSRRVGRFGEFADAHYIATVHPLVGLALADWLDSVAVRWPSWERPSGEQTHALRMADLILGGAA